MSLCCKNCFNEEHIEKFILDNGSNGDCDFCNSGNTICLDTSEIGDFIREGVKKAYEPLTDWYRNVDKMV
jgi:hypothetical protein